MFHIQRVVGYIFAGIGMVWGSDWMGEALLFIHHALIDCGVLVRGLF